MLRRVSFKFGVWPEQMRDYLTLVGDASDNIKGAKGIGPKKAAELLDDFGTLDRVYEALSKEPTEFRQTYGPAMVKALNDFLGHVDETRALLTLRTDVAVPFETIAVERTPKNPEPLPTMEDEMLPVDAPVSTSDLSPTVSDLPPSGPEREARDINRSSSCLTLTCSRRPSMNGSWIRAR